jgi:hypothetical protein
MDLVERYLAAIERGLPTAQAADIRVELRDVLLSRIEEQEERLGHPLSREESEALLVEFGQHLIGPDVFPFWWAALKTTLSIVAGVYLVLWIVAVAAEGTAPIMQRIWPSLWSAMLIAFAIVTLVGVAIELYTPARVLHKWRPGQLPPAGRKMRSRFAIAAEIAMGIVFLLWWSGFIHFRNLLPVRERLQIDMAPVWTDYHWPIFAFVIFEIGVNLYAMAKPGQSRANSGLSLLRYGLGAVLLTQVLQAGHWLVVSGGPLSPEGVEQIARNFDTGMRVGLLAMIAYFAVRAGWEALRLVTGREARLMGA